MITDALNVSPRLFSKFKWMSTFRTYTGRPRVEARCCWAGALTDVKLKQTSWMKWMSWLAFPWTWIVLIVACELGQMVPIRGVVGRTEGRIIKSFVSIRTPVIVTSASQDRASRYYHIAEDCKHYYTLQIPLYISSKEVNTNFTKNIHECKTGIRSKPKMFLLLLHVYLYVSFDNVWKTEKLLIIWKNVRRNEITFYLKLRICICFIFSKTWNRLFGSMVTADWDGISHQLRQILLQTSLLLN